MSEILQNARSLAVTNEVIKQGRRGVSGRVLATV